MAALYEFCYNLGEPEKEPIFFNYLTGEKLKIIGSGKISSMGKLTKVKEAGVEQHGEIIYNQLIVVNHTYTVVIGGSDDKDIPKMKIGQEILLLHNPKKKDGPDKKSELFLRVEDEDGEKIIKVLNSPSK